MAHRMNPNSIIASPGKEPWTVHLGDKETSCPVGLTSCPRRDLNRALHEAPHETLPRDPTELSRWARSQRDRRVSFEFLTQAPALSSRARRGGRAVECAGLENRYGLRVIGGSNPPLSASPSAIVSHASTDFGAVTQLVECQLCKLEVDGSSPFRSIGVLDRESWRFVQP